MTEEEEEEHRVFVMEEKRKNKSYQPKGNKMANKGKASFEIKAFDFVYFDSDPTSNRPLEKQLADFIKDAEIIFCERIGNKLLFVLRRWS